MRYPSAIAAIAVAAVMCARSMSAEPPRALVLIPSGGERALRPNVLGASVEPLVEHMLGRPEKLEAVRKIAPAIVRFPGGSQANFYDWHSGLLRIPVHADSSAYVKFWADAAPRIARAFPQGISLEDYAPFARALGAEVVLVPNLETSTVADQVAWFRRLAQDRVLPNAIELGNEFYLGMLGDSESMKRWPDEPATMAVMHEYERALRPVVGANAKFAVQSAASAFWIDPHTQRPFQRRLLAWDRALKPESWFEAVTLHLYPVPRQLAALPGGGTPAGLFRYLLGRGDAGVDRVIRETEARLPGKEIWITEWNGRGGEPPYPGQTEIVSPPMIAHIVTRMTLAYLRHPSITKSLYFMLNFDGNPAFQAYARDDGKYAPLPATVILGWFDHAANPGAHFQRVIESGANPVTAAEGDRYFEIEGGYFRDGPATTLVLQNTSTSDRTFDPTEGGRRPLPVAIDLIVTPNLGDFTHRPAEVRQLEPAKSVRIPARSVVRMIWR